MIKFDDKSYSQLGEDRILAHLFKKKEDVGVYVDVGAYHPVNFSNTALLHNAGWTGMNIDLSQKTIQLFNEIRPTDVNLQCAISDAPGILTTYLFGSGHSTINTCDYETALKWQKQFKQDFVISEVRSEKLQTLISENLQGPIDFLNIDIEGLELACLKGIDFSITKPKVIAIEIHCQSFEDIKSTEVYIYLKALGYRCVAYTIITAIFVR